MSHRFVHDQEFVDALLRLGLDETSPEIRALEISIEHKTQRPISSAPASGGGELGIIYVKCCGGGRLLVAYRDEGSTVTLLNLSREGG